MGFDLRGKKVIVTAGAAGIGRAIASRFFDAGAAVAICDIDSDAVSQTYAEHPEWFCFQADVGVASEVDAFISAALEHLDDVDILVNNAGISGPTNLIEDITPEEWCQTINVNVNSMYFSARRVIPLMKKKKEGVIINMSSTAGRIGMPRRSPYSTAKYAVRGFTDVLAVELGGDNIRVNAILPGLVNGARGRRVIAEQAAAAGIGVDAYMPALLHNISMHAMVEEEEIADMAVFLASDYARHVTGQSISVCGNFESYRAPLPR